MSDARRYRWASLVIESDMPLPELPRAAGRRPPDVVVQRASARQPTAAGTRCHEWRLPDGTRWATVARRAGTHVMRFQRFAEFVVKDCGRSIEWRAPTRTKPETVRHLLLDQVLPAVAFEHSLVGLHASAVAIDGEGVAFAGPASRGKSTLAASFAIEGHQIVTDDCLMLQWRLREPLAVPSYPSLRLWRDTADHLIGPASRLACATPVAEYTSKLRLDARAPALGFRRRPVRIRRLYILERGRGGARIDALSARQSYMELLQIMFRLDPLDRVAMHREVAALAALAGCVPVARLRVPSRLDALGDVHRAVLADLDALVKRP